MKFNENQSNGRRVVSMRAGGRTGMSKLMVAFRSFADAPVYKTNYDVLTSVSFKLVIVKGNVTDVVQLNILYFWWMQYFWTASLLIRYLIYVTNSRK